MVIASRTYIAKQKDVERKCYIIDAKNKILGRVATKAATILRGKHKVTYTPHIDNGDTVIIINAEKVKVSGPKAQTKEYQKYSGFHSGRKVITFNQLMAKDP